MTETRRYKEASGWVLRLNGESGEAEVSEWLRWCQAHPENLKAFEQVQADWRDVVALRQDASFSTLEPWARPQRRWRWSLAAAAALVLAVMAALSPWDRLLGTDRIVADTANLESSLPDGSLLVLRAQAAVKVSFAERERRLELLEDGEAYFRVQRDPRRPFIVQAGDLIIQAVGTAFDVRHDGDLIRVLVEEGSVSVSAPTGRWLVEAGHQLEYDRRGGPTAMATVDPKDSLRWRDGEFAYQGVPLAEVIQDVNRYSATPVLILDNEVRGMPYTGTVFMRAIDDWLEALSLRYPVHVRMTPSGERVLEPAP